MVLAIRLDSEPMEIPAPHQFFSTNAEEDFMESYCQGGMPAYVADDEVEE